MRKRLLVMLTAGLLVGAMSGPAFAQPNFNDIINRQNCAGILIANLAANEGTTPTEVSPVYGGPAGWIEFLRTGLCPTVPLP